jgi:hypothetical protein
MAEKFARLHLNRKKLGMVVNTCHLSYGRKHETGRLWSMSPQAKSETLFPK